MKNSLHYLAVTILLLSVGSSGCAILDAMGGTEGDNSPSDTTSPDAGDLDAGDAKNADDATSHNTGDADVSAPGDVSQADTDSDSGNICVPSSCGPCGLGRIVCDDTPGHETCQLPDNVIGEISDNECDQRLLFVDSLDGNDSNDGSPSEPFQTYSKARDAALAGQIIILSSGTGVTYEEALVVKNGVSVVGGFTRSADRFVWAPSNAPSKFAAPATSTTAGVFGLRATQIRTPTTIAHINLKTEDAPPGDNNYGAYILNTQELSLRGVSVISGAGGDGPPGDTGGPGADGEPGQTVQASVVTPNSPTYNYFAANFGGKPHPSCRLNDRSGTGGQGGNGARNMRKSTIQPTAGEHGALRIGSNPENGGTPGTNINLSGGNGTKGADRLISGISGSGGAPTGELSADNLWRPTGIGEQGNRGQTGQGGGGGGGANKTADIVASAPGGGGGGGGCGGEGGNGGQPGGASFGLFLVDSTIEIQDSSFAAGLGGNGGNGGAGGPGGLGGPGGSGSNLRVGPSRDGLEYAVLDATDAPTSGTGGKGGKGSSGGHGGGGAGGGSYGAYCFGTNQLMKSGSVTFAKQRNSQGGTVSDTPASNGHNGNQGESKLSVGCDI